MWRQEDKAKQQAAVGQIPGTENKDRRPLHDSYGRPKTLEDFFMSTRLRSCEKTVYCAKQESSDQDSKALSC